MEINYFGTLNFSNVFFPLLRSNARVVNVSSKLGLLTRVKNEELRKKIADPNNSIEQINQIAYDYIAYAFFLFETSFQLYSLIKFYINNFCLAHALMELTNR